jgi:hypothetical protein
MLQLGFVGEFPRFVRLQLCLRSSRLELPPAEVTLMHFVKPSWLVHQGKKHVQDAALTTVFR